MRARTPRAIRRRGPVAPRIPPNLSRHTQTRPTDISTDPTPYPPLVETCPGGAQNGGSGGGPKWGSRGGPPGGKKFQIVPTGRVIKYPKKCALFCPPGVPGPRGPKSAPRAGPPKRGVLISKYSNIGPKKGPFWGSRGAPAGGSRGAPGRPPGAPGPGPPPGAPGPRAAPPGGVPAGGPGRPPDGVPGPVPDDPIITVPTGDALRYALAQCIGHVPQA